MDSLIGCRFMQTALDQIHVSWGGLVFCLKNAANGHHGLVPALGPAVGEDDRGPRWTFGRGTFMEKLV